MADTIKGEVAWLSNARENISNTEEWKELVSDLFEAVQQQLVENHVSHFSHLTASEKILFLDRASKLVSTGLRHSNLVARVSAILDQQINEGIMGNLLNPSNTKTKTELVLDSACHACRNLLQKWPDLKSKLFSCLNRPLPSKLRKEIWQIFLANPKIRNDYLNSKKKSSKTSSLENVIEQRCQAFLSSEPCFEGLPNQQMSVIIHVMKNCLIYQHSSLKDSLADTDYLLVIPFLKVLVQDIGFHSDGCHGDSLDKTVALFVELFLSFMELRPTYMKDSGTKEFHAALKEVGETMATTLESQDHQLALSLVRSFSHENNSVSLAVCLSTLMRSYLRSLFVGYLTIDVVCYIWDQHILSVELQKLNCIPTFAVVLLILLRDKILECNNERDIEEVLLIGSKELKTKDFQNKTPHDTSSSREVVQSKKIDQHFMERWRQLVSDDIQGSELPMVDPVSTLGSTQPWTWWFQEQPATRQRPEDRHAAREAREMERKEEIQKQREEQTLRDALHQEVATHVAKITSLEQKLTQERQTRHTMEYQLSLEIRQLQEELTRLQAKQGLDYLHTSRHTHSDIPSAARTTSLPPTPVSSISVAQFSQEDELKNILKDLLSQATDGVNQMVHGTAQENEALQDVAKKVMKTAKDENKEAQLNLFQKELSEEDWENMTTEQRHENREKLLNKLKELHLNRSEGLTEH